MISYMKFLFMMMFAFALFIACGEDILISDGSEKTENSIVSKTENESPPYLPKVNEEDIDLGSSRGTPKELEAVWEAWGILNKEHVDRNSFKSEEFEESAIRGLIKAVEDQHTAYIGPVALEIEQTD